MFNCKGKRPRDWEASLILDYEFLNKAPKVFQKSSSLNMDFLKYPIVIIHEIGEQILTYMKKTDEKRKLIQDLIFMI